MGGFVCATPSIPAWLRSRRLPPRVWGALSRLDTFEAAMYDRRALAVDIDERPTGRRSLSAEVYVVRSSERARLSSEKWDPGQFRRLHLDAYLQGYAR